MIATSDLTIIAIIATQIKNAIEVERYIFDGPSYYIQAGKKLLKLSSVIIRNTANLRKTL